MDKIVYIYYPILIALLLWGASFLRKGEWNDEFFSLKQTKALQGFCAVCIMFHHIGQKTCASWLPQKYIVPGLEFFVPIGYYFVGIFLFCSGYGLYKSYQNKEHYFEKFFPKRILPIVLSYYTTGWIFLAVRFLMGEKMSVAQVIYYATGLQLSNPNAWFVVALPFFYLFFYVAFHFFRNEKVSVLVLCLLIFAYTWIGTILNHPEWWMKGEWWYNSVHFFVLGVLFAKHEKTVLEKVKKHYVLYMTIFVLLAWPLYIWSEVAQNIFSYYGELFHGDHIVLRRWGCLIAQMLASCAFVFSILLAGLKIKIGNRFLSFMGTITLEFYLIHGLFVELFGYCFIDLNHSLYYIKNVALFVLVVFIPSIPAALLLQKFHKLLLRGKKSS